MALIDERGRLFGRINLIDLAVIVFVAVLIPLGYGAYLVFRAPAPHITGMYERGPTSVPVTFRPA